MCILPTLLSQKKKKFTRALVPENNSRKVEIFLLEGRSCSTRICVKETVELFGVELGFYLTVNVIEKISP